VDFYILKMSEQQVLEQTDEMVRYSKSFVDDVEFSAQDCMRADPEFVYKLVRTAIAAGATVVLLDDGFQNPALHKDLSLIVVDATVGFGNGRVLPAGPLREPLKVGLKRGNVVVSVGGAKAQATLPDLGLPRLQAALKPLQMGMDWRGARVLAFAGIGRPEKFFSSLAAQGAEIVAQHSFADHAPYSTAVLQRLAKEAASLGAQLVTTEKDAARLPASFRPQVLAFPVRLKFADESTLVALLKTAQVPL